MIDPIPTPPTGSRSAVFFYDAGMNTFQDKTAVLTGAASGFGLELARLAAAQGMRLMLVDIRDEPLQAVAAELRAQGAQVATRCMDVASAAETEALADETERRFGPVHLLFNNAGVAFGGLLWEHTERDWDWVMGANLLSIAHAIRAFVPRMLAAARADAAYEAHVVNTASMAGLLVTPNLGAYTVSKHAAVAISEQLYHDLLLVTRQVHAAVLCPYFVPTGIYDSERYRPAAMQREEATTTSQQLAYAAGEKAVLGGLVPATEVAQMVLDGVREQRFWIYTHPRAMRPVRQRMESMLAATNPRDSMASRPSATAAWREALGVKL